MTDRVLNISANERPESGEFKRYATNQIKTCYLYIFSALKIFLKIAFG